MWVPNEPDGWAPYRDGNWTYEPYYGWTWVGYEPWGWAPYHYGRWFSYGGCVGLVARSGLWRRFLPSVLGAGVCLVLGLGRRLWLRSWFWRLGRLRLAPDRALRLVPSVVGWISRPLRRGQRQRMQVYNRFGGFAPLHGGTRFSNVANIHDNHIGRALSTVNAAHFGAGRVTGDGCEPRSRSTARA